MATMTTQAHYDIFKSMDESRTVDTYASIEEIKQAAKDMGYGMDYTDAGDGTLDVWGWDIDCEEYEQCWRLCVRET